MERPDDQEPLGDRIEESDALPQEGGQEDAGGPGSPDEPEPVEEPDPEQVDPDDAAA
jgi:hypothetical protein